MLRTTFRSSQRAALARRNFTGAKASRKPIVAEHSLPSNFFAHGVVKHEVQDKALASATPSPETVACTQMEESSVVVSSQNRKERLEFNRKLNSLRRAVSEAVQSTETICAETIHELQKLKDSDPPLYWQKVPRWQATSTAEFLSYSWQIANTIETKESLFTFLTEVLPSTIPPDGTLSHIKTSEDFVEDVRKGMEIAPMAVRITPHILSVIDWSRPLQDPVRRQFLPMSSSAIADHRHLEMDSLHEAEHAIAPGLIMRYLDKALFLATSVCPVYCRYCTRSYAIGANTETVTKKSLKPTNSRWDEAISVMWNTPALNDIVISGGDCFYLDPMHIDTLGKRILNIPHIRRIRFASKGLAVCPSRFLDPHDVWSDALIGVSNYAKKMGKSVALHTHFNHPNEITWVTKKASQRLLEAGVTVRNQSVLLRGVNDDFETMSGLIRGLADMNISPYYVYQGDMVKGVEDLRTPLRTILDLEARIRGCIGGFLVPTFVVDLPGGGGKRLANSYISYDKITGTSKFLAPSIGGDRVFEYHDPEWSLPDTLIQKVRDQVQGNGTSGGQQELMDELQNAVQMLKTLGGASQR